MKIEKHNFGAEEKIAIGAFGAIGCLGCLSVIVLLGLVGGLIYLVLRVFG